MTALKRAERVSEQAQWREEIRGHLVAGLYKGRTRTALDAEVEYGSQADPAFRWWLFEGREWGLLGGALHEHFPELVRQLRRLLQSHSPISRDSHRPDGEVDWPATFSRGPQQPRRFVVRASRLGLGARERAVLRGWLRWLLSQWAHFCKTWDLLVPPPAMDALRQLEALAAPATDDVNVSTLRRWAVVAVRARWPLFRHLVGPSLRAHLEGLSLDSLPLPTERDRLFELLVLVRVAAALDPSGPEVRWFRRRDLDKGDPTVQLGRLQVHWHHAFPRGEVWQAATSPGYADAAKRFGLPEHLHLDLLFDLSALPTCPFDRLAIEVKSGAQSWGKAQWQVWSYGKALAARGGGPLLAWGLSESGPAHPEGCIDSWLAEPPALGEPTWLFSSIHDLQRVAHACTTRRPQAPSNTIPHGTTLP